jgi:sec-independent protein translocase protein TatA
MLGKVGMPELLIIAFICLLIFGPRALPKLGKGLGETIRGLKGAKKQFDDGLHEVDQEVRGTVDDMRRTVEERDEHERERDRWKRA